MIHRLFDDDEDLQEKNEMSEFNAMSEVSYNLYIGTMYDGLTQTGKMSVLNVMWEDERKDFASEGYTHIQTTFYDRGNNVREADSDNMDQAADWIKGELERGNKVLVHCAVVMERSPLTVVWYLMRHRNLSLDEAYDLVKFRRKETIDRCEWLPENVVKSGRL